MNRTVSPPSSLRGATSDSMASHYAPGATARSGKFILDFSAIHSFIEITFALCRANGFRNRFCSSSLAVQSASRKGLKSTV